jgi:AraC family transcriptional regulator of adaptative response / DNA-3-methyladenine glycosylase II
MTITRTLGFSPPLDWTALLACHRARATPGVELVDGDAYRRVIEIEGRPATIAVAPAGEARLELRADGVGTRHLDRVVARVRRMFDLDLEPGTLARAFRGDSLLAKLVRARPGVRVPSAWDPFELVVRAILGQQVSVAAATTLAGRLASRFGAPLDPPRAGLSRRFPRPSVLAEADFGGIGLTRARSETIRNLARVVANGELRLESLNGLDDIVTRLVALPGIGQWTAQYVALRAFGERDAFPASDLGLRRAMANGSGLLSEADVLRRAERWRPLRAYAAIYLWTSDASVGAG